MKSIYREQKWAEFCGKKEEGILREFRYEKEEGKLVYRFFQRKAGVYGGTTYFDIASYRGAQGPYLEETKEGREVHFFQQFQKEFEEYCKENRIIAEFAKLDPWDDYAPLVREQYDAGYYGNFYCINLEHDFYAIDYNRRAKRSIQKAKNGGVRTEFDFSGDTAEQFIRLYANTEKKYHISPYYQFQKEDIRAFFDAFAECFLINAYLEDKIIASALAVMGKDIAHYLLLGVDPAYADLQANSLMTLEAALYAEKKGRKWFDMGGGVPGGGVEQFKRNFISEEGVWKYYAVKKIHNKEIYQKLVEKKGEIQNPAFFPLYRG